MNEMKRELGSCKPRDKAPPLTKGVLSTFEYFVFLQEMPVPQFYTPKTRVTKNVTNPMLELG